MPRPFPLTAAAALASALLATPLPAQTPTQTPTQTPAQTPGQSPVPTPRPPAIPAVDPKSPLNAGRVQLTTFLDDLAVTETAQRHTLVSALTTRPAAEARQRMVRDRILALLGPLPPKTPLNPRSFGTTPADGFRIEKILFESQPGFPVTALLYTPDPLPPARLPAIVVAPGHGPTGKASDFAFSATLARNGFAVLSYDPIGQGERLQYPDPAHPGTSLAVRPTGEHGEAGLQPTLLGNAVAQFFLWDGIRAVDFLQSRPEIDPERIGAFGCSGGGAMTALLGALDPRIKAIGTACYITTFDALLPSIGPQDAEQSIPNFLAAGLDLPDWIELAAPRPYAIISTTADMFPFAGAQKAEAEARGFYRLFNADSSLAFLTGPGGHGNLRPIQSRIVSFFLQHLQPGSDFAHPLVPPVPAPGTPPAAPPAALAHAFQVTSTGQVLTAFPGSETVHTLTLKRLAALPTPPPLSGDRLRSTIREVTHALAQPQPAGPPADLGEPTGLLRPVTLHSEPGIDLHGILATPSRPGTHPAILLLTSAASAPSDDPTRTALDAELNRLALAGNIVLALTPRPSPPGTEETKAPILGPFYLTELRAELVGRTLLGMRVDDTIRAADFLAALPGVAPRTLAARASGSLALVLLHAAVLDPRLTRMTLDAIPPTFRSLVETPMPVGAPESILPGVLLHYDVPDLTRALGPRLTTTPMKPGS